MTTSVALCTYNGEKFLREQLDSILSQTISVDEIVVGDDGSSDNTLAIIKEYQRKSNIPIRIYSSENNLGPSTNFERTLNLCKGDIIFLSDQDDIWNVNKVENIINYFLIHPDKSVVFTNATIIDEKGIEYSKYDVFDCVNFDNRLQHFFNSGFEISSFFLNKAVGATMAIRRESIFHFSQFCDDRVIYHDYCLCLKAIDTHSLGYIDKHLMKYRTHKNQKSGIKLQNQEPVKRYHQYRLINIIPNNFIFNNNQTVAELDLYQKRIIFDALDCIKNISYYCKIYSYYGLIYCLYDTIVKLRN